MCYRHTTEGFWTRQTCRRQGRGLWSKRHQTQAVFLQWKYHGPTNKSQTKKSFTVHPLQLETRKADSCYLLSRSLTTAQLTAHYRWLFKCDSKNCSYRLGLLWCPWIKPHSGGKQGFKLRPSATIWKEGRKSLWYPSGISLSKNERCEKDGPGDLSIHQMSLMFLPKPGDAALNQVGGKKCITGGWVL